MIDKQRIADVRKQFEKWMASPPFEHSVRRYPKDETRYGWPGGYRSVAVQLAWCAWCAALGLEATND